MTRRMQASEELPARDLETGPAEVQQHRHRRAARVIKVLALGGVVALVTKDDLRSRLLDALFGPEEEFEYDSVTEPVAPGLHPQEGETFRPGGAQALTEDAEGPDEELWSIPAPEAEAPVSIVHDPPPSSHDARFPTAHPVDAETEDSLAADRDTPVSSFSAAARSYDAPAPAYEADAPAYESPAPAYEAPAPTYEPPASTYEPPAYDPPAPVYETPTSGDDGPAWAAAVAPHEETPASSYEPPAPPASDAPAYGVPEAAHESSAPAYEAPAPPYEAPASGEETSHPADTAGESPATGTTERSYETPSYEAPSYQAPSGEVPSYEAPSDEAPSDEAPHDEYPVYEPVPGAWEAPKPTATFDAPTEGTEDAARTEAGGEEPPAAASVADVAVETAGHDTPAEPPEPAESSDRPAVEPASSLTDALTDPSPDTSVPAPFTPEAPPVAADAPEAPPAEAEAPAIGEAAPGETAPRRSGWWLPRRRRASSTPEPPRWE
jgi:hypothetical protein